MELLVRCLVFQRAAAYFARRVLRRGRPSVVAHEGLRVMAVYVTQVRHQLRVRGLVHDDTLAWHALQMGARRLIVINILVHGKGRLVSAGAVPLHGQVHLRLRIRLVVGSE